MAKQGRFFKRKPVLVKKAPRKEQGLLYARYLNYLKSCLSGWRLNLVKKYVKS